MDWNGQENFSLSCELWVGTNDFNTKKNFLVRSNPRIYNFPEWKLALRLLHMMNVRFSLLNMAQRILGVTLPNF